MEALLEQSLSPLLTLGFGSAIVYCVLLGMTFSFLIIYIKRMVTIAFLIIISPLVTVTYAIDKMGDSKSQALNTWLKEFVYNVLIQPFHCIIYMVFVSTAINLLTTSPIGNLGTPVFAIVCIMFMNKAEDILRKIFAFDKNTKTLGSGLASAALIGSGLSTVSSLFKKEESSQKKATGEAIPDIAAMHKNKVAQNTKNEQIDEAMQEQTQEVQDNVGKGIQNTVHEAQRETRKNRAIESWQNSGKIRGTLAKGAELTTKASLPVFTALLGAGQGNLKSAIGAGTAGYAIEKGIERGVGKITDRSQAEMSRQAKANEAAFATIYKEQEAKWTQEQGRWAEKVDGEWKKISQEEIANDTRRILKIKDINSIKDKDERQWASIVHALNDTYKSMGDTNPEGHVVEVVRRLKSKGR